MEPQLFESLKRGDASAWEEAFRLLYPCAFSAARHPTAGVPPEEAEDVAIETLALLAGKVAQVKNFNELKALTVTIAVRKAISLNRKKYAEKRGGNQTGSLDQMKEESEGSFEPASRLESMDETSLGELAGLLREAMEGLENLTCDLLRDYLLNEIPYKDLAARHGIPMGTVGVHLHRGLARIRAKLEQFPRLMKELRLFLR